MALNDRLAALLTESRDRTLSLVAPYDDAVLRRQHDPLMSPLVWDLAHVANYEDLWLVRALGGAATRTGLDDLYDAFKQPRNVRESLPLLSPSEARAYGAEVRARAVERLAAADLSPDAADPLLRHGFVHNMVVQHEHQHDETMLAAVQLLPVEEGHRLDAAPPPPAGHAPTAHEVRVPEGPFCMGADHPWAYDNERPCHQVHLAAYWIDAAPVTNGDYQAFIADGGYDDPRWWGAEGWAWRQEADLTAPQFWHRDGDGWQRTRFGHREPVPTDEPVQHVCWHEADAFARWAGKRLPTEAEWERAAAWDDLTGLSRAWPWGDDEPMAAHANLGQRHLGPAPVGAYPDGVSAVGCHQMLGDVWEWTATAFGPHPGFEPFPYEEYSAVFHGDRYKVLRGGSWATHPSACRTTFRNWDLPIRRQIFAGFRCAGRRCRRRPLMCRHLAYLGPPRSLASLLYEPEQSLERQSWKPLQQREGAMNADGWGVGWWDPAVRHEPARYRTEAPMWTDRSFRSVAEVVHAGAITAAVRSATPPSPIVDTGNAPFVAGPWLFSLNGFVTGFRGEVGEELRRSVSHQRAIGIEGTTDSEVLFALVLDALDAGAGPAAAIARVTADVLARTDGHINLLLTDGRTIVASTCGNSLFTLSERGLASGGVLVASEPLDDDEGWVQVPDRSIVEAHPGEVRTSPLEHREGAA